MAVVDVVDADAGFIGDVEKAFDSINDLAVAFRLREGGSQ